MLAPPTTKNASGECDLKIHQMTGREKAFSGTFRPKALGVGAKEGMGNSVVTTAANVADWCLLLDVLHGEKDKTLANTLAVPEGALPSLFASSEAIR